MGKSNDAYSMKRRKNRKGPICDKIKIFPRRSILYRRIVSILAAKKRLKKAKRSNTQGICFKQETAANLGKTMIPVGNGNELSHEWTEHVYPSKFFMMCLNTIQISLENVGALKIEDGPLFANAWGVEFWNCYTNGKNVLETSGADSTREQIAWMASAAADTITRKENEGLSFNSPFHLFLVPSLDKAFEVRQVWKPLENVGIYTLSLHSGTSIEKQIHRLAYQPNLLLTEYKIYRANTGCVQNFIGEFFPIFGKYAWLKCCEPEFLVSTPERLFDLLSLKAVDISEVSFLVIDGLEAPFRGSYYDAIKSIRQSISGNPRTVVFSDCTNKSSISMLQKLLGEPERR